MNSESDQNVPQSSSGETSAVTSTSTNNTTQPAGGQAVRKTERLSGAARKRFRRLAATNMSKEEALALCKKPWSEIPIEKPPPDPKAKAKKQARSEVEPQRIEHEKPKKMTKVEHTAPPPSPPLSPPPPSSSPPPTKHHHQNLPKPKKNAAAGPSRVGIRNSIPMSEEQMRLVHQALLMSIERNGVGLKFAGFTHKEGWIVVTCVNQDSHDWLVEEVANIKPWPEAELSAILERNLPKRHVAYTYLPNSEVDTVEKALKLLRVQNEGLNTEFWRILRQKADGSAFQVAFSLDDASVEALEAAEGKAVLGFKVINFSINKGTSVYEKHHDHTSKESTRPSTSSYKQKMTRKQDSRRITPDRSRQRLPPRSTLGRGETARDGTSSKRFRSGEGTEGRPRASPRAPHTPTLPDQGSYSWPGSSMWPGSLPSAGMLLQQMQFNPQFDTIPVQIQPQHPFFGSHCSQQDYYQN